MITLADRVKETTTSTGTGTINLGGAQTGYRTFVSGIGTTNQTDYVIADQNGANWEVGAGVVTSGSPDTLTRATVYASSNAGALVNFTAGTKDVFCVRRANAAPIYVTKTGDESRQSTTTLTGDSDLAFPVLANTLYLFEFCVFFGTPTTGGFKYDLNHSVGIGAGWLDSIHEMLVPGATAWSNIGIDNALNVVRNTVVSGADAFVRITGRLHNGANAGFVNIRWAQQASQASNTSVWNGSWVSYKGV